MSPLRRDSEGNHEVGPTWESLIERQIREAAERGDFDDLPHYGRRLPVQDEINADDEYALARIVLRNASAVPAWIAIDREIRDLLAARDALLEGAREARQHGHDTTARRERDKARLREIVRTANAAILRLDFEAPSAHLQRAPLDIDRELRRLDEAFS